MRAAFYERCGGAADVLEVGELPDLVVGPGEVRVAVAASGVNPSDVKARAGSRPMTFERIVPRVAAHLEQAGVKPGIMLAWYEEPADDGSIVVHAGFDVGDDPLSSSTDVQVVDLPVIETPQKPMTPAAVRGFAHLQKEALRRVGSLRMDHGKEAYLR